MLRGRAGAPALVPPADPVGLTPLIEVGDAVPLVRHMLRSRTNASANRAELQWALSPAWHPPQTNASCLTLPEASSGAGCASCNDRRVTLGLLYFDEPEVLRSQLANWATWPPAVQRRFDFVVVDDCSQRQRSAAGVLSHSLIDGMPDVRVLTILPPKRAWNIGGGRNLIMHLSRTCWVLICDLDYALSPSLAGMVADATRMAGGQQVFKFHRLQPSKPIHPGIALLRRELYWAAGGCDEDFVGHYGYTDPHVWLRLRMHSPAVDIAVNRSWPPLIAMSEHLLNHTSSLTRNPAVNRRLFQKKRSGELPWSNNYLRFRWVEKHVVPPPAAASTPWGRSSVTSQATNTAV